MNQLTSETLERVERGKKVTLRKEEIMSILPHRGRMLLLDEVEVTSQKATGTLLVTEDFCKGHAVTGERLVFRGVDMEEMAAQLLGVVWGVQHPKFTKRAGLLRGIGRSKFFGGPVFVGDTLIVEIERRNIRDRVVGGPEPERMSVTVVAKDFLVRVKKENKATIEHIKLVIAPQELSQGD